MPAKVLPSDEASYKQFLSGITEMVNSFLKPDVKSKWVKIDLIMVPTPLFQHLLFDLGLHKPYSARRARHPLPLKQESTIAFYYNIFDVSALTHLFASTLPSLKLKAYHRNNQEVRGQFTSANLGSPVSARDKVALARQRAGARWGPENLSGGQKPTSRRELKCEEGEWPRTREFQLQWWLQVFSHANCGHFRLRFYVEHVELSV